MARLKPVHVRLVTKFLAKDLARILRESEGRLFLCGGFIRETIRGDWPKDADIFGLDAEEVKAAGLALGAMRGYDETPYAITVKGLPRTTPNKPFDPPVQFVYTWPVASPLVAIQRMDFTMCQAAIWYRRGWHSVCTKEFYPDVQEKRLRYTWPEREGTAGRSLVRAMNFVKRGWTFPASEIASLVAHTAHEVEDPEGTLDREASQARYARNISGLYPIGSEKAA